MNRGHTSKASSQLDYFNNGGQSLGGQAVTRDAFGDKNCVAKYGHHVCES